MERKFWIGASLGALVLAATLAPWSASKANGVSVRVNTPHIGIRIGAPHPAYYPPVYAPAPIYAPPPVVYAPPRYIPPPRVVYGYPYYRTGGYYHRHHWNRHHWDRHRHHQHPHWRHGRGDH